MSVQFYNGQYIPIESNATGYVHVGNALPGAQVVLTSPLTATGNQADILTAISNYGGQANAVLVTVEVTAVGGTTPTLTVNLQGAGTAGGSYATVASSPSITATGTYQFVALLGSNGANEGPNINDFYRTSWVIGGTTPSFTLQIYARPFFLGALN